MNPNARIQMTWISSGMFNECKLPSMVRASRAVFVGAVVCVGLTATLLAQGSREPRIRPHWPKGAVIASWIDVRNAPPEGDQLVERAMQTWNTAGEGRLTLRRTLVRSDAAIEVAFVDTGNYGETYPHVDPKTGLIDRAGVAIAAEVPGEVFTRQIIAYLTALHELGHAIGLEHTTNFSDIMYLFRRPDDGARYFGNYRALVRSPADIGSATATGLSASDVTALRTLYDDK